MHEAAQMTKWLGVQDLGCPTGLGALAHPLGPRKPAVPPQPPVPLRCGSLSYHGPESDTPAFRELRF